ncbi:RrF2 family transcriptional regulator [Sinisalibacter aestuarii]|uniref:Rrf2 family transcriptional regulator n=1 Tax=Sinisalibacter aestuarii TaxID=2949426 RepID=A0ABQ5LVX6_9RHOB|nr:Rrf2 family transcriptional regulator [Sinisalibacter aestuarii]GKY89116.1 Rrf2 family transcriptional regulator [Sinisalibacter aestuarii]
MRLTSFTDYGLRALMQLAAEPARLFTTDEIAGAFGISRNHLKKIVQELSAAGIVVTQRGANGGFRLARPPDQIGLGEIVRVLEARSALVECFRADGGACVLNGACGLKTRLNAAREAFLRDLDRSTLADCALPPARVGQDLAAP